MNITLDYKNKTLREIISYAPPIEIPTNSEPSVIAAVKIIIFWKEDQSNGFLLEFNKDYSKIIKRPYPEYLK